MKKWGIAASLLLLVTLSVFLHAQQAQQATVQEEERVFKTYPFSGPDPAPIMTRSSMWGKGPRLYPYFFFDELSYTGADQPWKVVRMENPYVQLLVLPAEGGKLIGAIEKSTGRQFIYFNHVLKFRDIALRGPWTSGGIELNFGIVGHTPATATPVDYLYRKNPDGSVSCFVGTMDLPSRTQWRVEFVLYPDKAYFESRPLWYNPQPLNQSYYVWMNAANKLSNDLEFIFPGTMHIGHNYAVPERPWPITKDGRNLAFYKEHDDSDEGSFFIFGAFNDFSGGYWHDSRFGYGHWAFHEDVPGQKFFRWPLSGAGQIWESLLTDTDGPYFEPQNGRLLDQNDHEFFAPYTTDQWREVWFPYKKIGPMVKATPYGALNARNTGDAIEVAFCALQKIDEDLVIRSGEKEIYHERIALAPMEVYEKKIAASVKKGDLRVDVGDKLSYADNPDADLLKRPLNFRNYEDTTVEGLFQNAEREDKGRNYELALEKYLEVLKREPQHMRALTRVAELYCRRAEYAKSLEYARKALDFVMYDPDANYIYGVTSRRMGDLVDAKETLGWAARSMQYRSSANCQLGEIYLMEGKSARALEFLKRSLEYDAHNVKALEVLSTAYRLTKQPGKAAETLRAILEIDPLNHLARFEQYLLEPGPERLNGFKSMIRNELPHETYLEIAMYYVDLGLMDDALRLLEAAPEQATIRYWQAYLLREKSPARSMEMVKQAAALSPYLVFPYREESIPVFQWADKALPGNWKAKYYLALIYWGLRRQEEALDTLNQLGDQPDYAPAYVSRAWLEKDSDSKRALADFERARAVDPKDWRNWFHLASYCDESGMHQKAMELSVEASKRFPDEDHIKVLLARTYLDNGRYRECYAVLENATILPFEGQRDVHDLFVRCQVCLAMEAMKQGRYEDALKRLEGSKEYPARLGTGKPHDPDYRVQDYLMAFTYEKMGKGAQAADAQKRIVDYLARNSRGGAGTVSARVNQWYATTFPAQNELQALKDLMKIVQGNRRRHED
jgi:tetratricopeptide (TPR) repeat protein